jgi:hypothetical protein
MVGSSHAAMVPRSLVVACFLGTLLLLLPAQGVATSSATEASTPWSDAQASMFRVSVPPGWVLVEIGATDFALLAPKVIDGFQLNVVFTIFDGLSARGSLEGFANEVIRAHSADPSLQERTQSRERIVVAGRPAERVVSVGRDSLQYMTTFFVDGNRGYEVAAVAPASAFAEYQAVYRRISDSFRISRRGDARVPPLPRKVLLMPAELGGADVPANRTWLYPAAANAKASFDARVRSLVEAGEEVGYSAIPEYEGASLLPKAVRMAAQRGDGTVLTRTIANTSK